MAFNLISLQSNHSAASPSQVVIGVYSPENKQVFKDAAVMKLIAKSDATLAKSPRENGTTTTDNRILNPSEVELLIFLPPGLYKNVYQQIKDLFLAGTLLSVQTKVDTYTNMLISSMPHDEEPDVFNAIWMHVKLEEASFADTTTSGFSPSNPANKSTVNRGTLQNVPATPTQTSAAKEYLYDSFKRIIS